MDKRLLTFLLGGLLVYAHPLLDLPCTIESMSDRITCRSSLPSLTLSGYQFGSITINTTSTITTIYNNYSDCLVSGCHNYNVRCDCTNSVGSNSCVLGAFYSLRRGVGSNGTCLFGAFSPLRECADTNWVPSTVSPSPYCPNFRISVNPVINTTGNLFGINYAYSSLVSADYNTSGLYKFGNSLVTVSNSSMLQKWSIGSFFSSTVQYAWPSNCSGNPSSLSDPRLGSFQRSYCQNLSTSPATLNVSTVYDHFLFLRQDRWFTFKSVFPTGNITIRYCQYVCEHFDVSTSTYSLLPSGTYVYSTDDYPFQCITTACINKECCDPSYIPSPDPCLGSVNGVCSVNITYFDYTTNSFVGHNTNTGYYCSSSTGDCFKVPSVQEWGLNNLSLLLISLLAAVAIGFAVAVIIKVSSSKFNTM